MNIDGYYTTADALDCFGQVIYRLVLRFDGTVRVVFPSGRTVDVDQRSGTILTCGEHLDPVIIEQCRSMRP